MRPDRVIEHAPAKINLALHVTGRRADGLHELDSLVVFARLGDRVELTPAQGPHSELALAGPFAAALAGEDQAANLAMRAAALMSGRPLRITLFKRLPVAAGIGGGSADAAAVLRALARLTGRPLPAREALMALGADVPVCLDPRPALMRGAGEAVSRPGGLPALALVLVNPRVALPTAQVFAALERRANPPLGALPAQADAEALAAWLRSRRNDLEAPAVRLAPVIGEALAALGAQPGCRLARMSGSGATVFGLFGTMAEACAAARALSAARPEWWVRATSTLPSRP